MISLPKKNSLTSPTGQAAKKNSRMFVQRFHDPHHAGTRLSGLAHEHAHQIPVHIAPRTMNRSRFIVDHTSDPNAMVEKAAN
jgi:hypothetical protein